jgi:hypothetical protein
MFGCFRSYRGWVVLTLAILIGGYLAIWHGTHVAVVLPFLVILACPLMHMFMHGGHGHHRGNGTKEQSPPVSGSDPPQSPDKGE